MLSRQRRRPQAGASGNFSPISNVQRSKPNDARSTANDLSTNATDGPQAAGADESHEAAEASADEREVGAGRVHPRLEKR